MSSKERTILRLIDDVHAAATNLGMDVSVKDIGFIVSLFLEGLAAHPAHAEIDAPLLAIAAEVAKAEDERS